MNQYSRDERITYYIKRSEDFNKHLRVLITMKDLDLNKDQRRMLEVAYSIMSKELNRCNNRLEKLQSPDYIEPNPFKKDA